MKMKILSLSTHLNADGKSDFTADELYGISPHLLQLFRRMLLWCFVVKLQKYIFEYETSPSLLLSWG